MAIKMEKRKCVIFGAGERGTNIYQKLSLSFHVIAYADNNKALWGQQRNGTAIIPPDGLPELINNTGAAIFIANELHYRDIGDQLDSYGLTYYNCESYLAYELDGGVLYPVSLGRPAAYKKPDNEKFAVLFVQVKPCTRTNKIAQVLKERGVLTYSAYIASPSDAGSQAYLAEFPFWTYKDLLDFVNESEFDIVHCSNEPDTLVNLLIHSNKKVIHDCHDIVTMSKRTYTSAEAMLEYLANTRAGGVISPTERVRDILIRKYGTDPEKTLVVGNYPLSSFGKVKRRPKLSAADGALHCVYEGFVVDRSQAETMPYRFFDPIFLRLAGLGIHVHIYSHSAPEYLRELAGKNPLIHYEGNYSGTELIARMTQYDVGLLLHLGNTIYPLIASPNKMTEYLSAGLPVITNISTFADILTENNCGGMVYLDREDLAAQIRKYQKLPVSDDFCDTHGFTMDAHAERILDFYKKVTGRQQ